MIRYRGHKFKKRVGEDELEKITLQTYQKTGFDNMIRGKMLFEICQQVNSRWKFRFIPLISKPKIRKANAWIYSYSFIYYFLEEFKMKTTINTFDFELKNNKLEYNNSFLNGQIPSQYLLNIIKVKKRQRKVQFSLLVEDYKNQRIKEQSKMKNKANNTNAIESNSYISSSINDFADESVIDDESK